MFKFCKEAFEWKDAGFIADDAYNYKGRLEPLRYSYENDPNRKYEITLDKALHWKNNNFIATEAHYWTYHDFTLGEAVKWHDMNLRGSMFSVVINSDWNCHAYVT